MLTLVQPDQEHAPYLRPFFYAASNDDTTLARVKEEFIRLRDKMEYVVIPNNQQHIYHLAMNCDLPVVCTELRVLNGFIRLDDLIYIQESLIPNIYFIYGHLLQRQCAEAFDRLTYCRNIPAMWY